MFGTLPDIVEAIKLDHEMVCGVASGFDEGDRMVARVGMEEIGVERPRHVVGEAEAGHVDVDHRIGAAIGVDSLVGRHRGPGQDQPPGRAVSEHHGPIVGMDPLLHRTLLCHNENHYY